MGLVFRQHAVQQRLFLFRRQRMAGQREAAPHQFHGAAPDQRPGGIEVVGGDAFLVQYDIQGADDIRRGIDQGAVEIEGQHITT